MALVTRHSVETTSAKKGISSIKAIIFDCDGTLIDSEEAHHHSWKIAYQNQGKELHLEKYLTFLGRSFEVISKMLQKEMQYFEVERLIEDKKIHYSYLQQVGLPSIQDTVDFVHLLAAQKEELGIKLAVASAAMKEEILHNLKSLGIHEVFDGIFSGKDDLKEYKDPEGVNKPKPYIYLHAAKMLGCNPKECIAIEDSNPGVTAAVHAGCFTIAVPNHYTIVQDLSLAHLRLKSFAGINPRAFLDQIVKNGKEI